jgi:hypothetical protein
MIDELPEPTSPQSIYLRTFCNIYGAKADAKQALEVSAREYMRLEYSPGAKKGESMVTTVLVDRWLKVHADMIGDAAYIS